MKSCLSKLIRPRSGEHGRNYIDIGFSFLSLSLGKNGREAPVLHRLFRRVRVSGQGFCC